MKTIFLRFYEELNDFLPAEKRKRLFEHKFWGQPSIKDVIESLGVPHTEVDLILVNGESVSFNYLVKDNDHISVYPEFETFDISNLQKLRKTSLRKPKFICDVHLGKLARNLRMFGFDVYYENNLNDEKIVEISLKEKRTILTRDLGILKRSNVIRGYFVRSENPQEQIIEIINRFHLTNQIKPFTLCLECGSKLKRISKKEIIHLIPEKVKKTQNRYFICTQCKKIYWRGIHFEKMNATVKKIKSLLV
ncbi:Mut7-C RNAse domain-containing protein [Rosettibacter firmus]|uniref:Mut7-C RNAse domain-containing protein n=1 Tax=Rosettibacter firmus TaxID=3111522 RepID=UPI00336BB52B